MGKQTEHNGNAYDGALPESSSSKNTQQSYVEATTLKDFLDKIGTKYKSPTTDYSLITDEDKTLDLIMRICKAKKYVGAGVGGLLVKGKGKNTEVLLYLRPKDPEKYKWSIIGGSICFGQNAKEALKAEIKNIIDYTVEKTDLVPLRITNHKEIKRDNCVYHYLSPAFIVYNHTQLIKNVGDKIKQEKDTNKSDSDKQSLAKQLMQGEQQALINKLKKDIDSGNYFLQNWEEDLQKKLVDNTLQQYIVKWFKISEVTDENKFSLPTIRAIDSYTKRNKEIHRLKDEIHNIKLEEIIETDD